MKEDGPMPFLFRRRNQKNDGITDLIEVYLTSALLHSVSLFRTLAHREGAHEKAACSEIAIRAPDKNAK